MMELINENTTRKIDSLGRVSIPKGLRNRLRLEPNDELEFYTLREDGQDYICCTKAGGNPLRKYEIVADMLDELGIKIPDEIIAKLQEG